MISEAIDAARGGAYCFYVVANQREVERCAREVGELFDGCKPAGKDKVYVGQCGGSISFVRAEDELVDLRAGRYLGAHPSCKFFADEYALQQALRNALPWAWDRLRDSHYLITRTA